MDQFSKIPELSFIWNLNLTICNTENPKGEFLAVCGFFDFLLQNEDLLNGC